MILWEVFGGALGGEGGFLVLGVCVGIGDQVCLEVGLILEFFLGGVQVFIGTRVRLGGKKYPVTPLARVFGPSVEFFVPSK